MKTTNIKSSLALIITISIWFPTCTSSQKNEGAFYTAGKQTSNGYVFTYQKVPSPKQLDDIVKKVCERFDNISERFEKDCNLGYFTRAMEQARLEFIMLGFNNLDASNGNKFLGSNIRADSYWDFYKSQLWQYLSSSQKELLEAKMERSDAVLFNCIPQIDERESVKATTSSNPQQNLSKLLALLANPMSAGQLGQFSNGDKVAIPRALLSVTNVQTSNNLFYYLVSVNDYNVTKPFYILTNRRLNLMNLEFRNTIFEDLELEYIGKRDYYSYKVRQETFIFKLSSMR